MTSMKYRKTILLTLEGLALILGIFLICPILLGRLPLWLGISLSQKTQNLVVVILIIAVYGYFSQKVITEINAIRGATKTND